MDQLTERLEKIQADNELRLSDLESGDPKKIAKKNKDKKKGSQVLTSHQA